MKDFTKFDAYELNEADIDTVIAYLKIVDPENATPENAIDFLEYYQSLFHEAGHISSDADLEKLYNEFSKKPKKSDDI